MSRSIEMGCDRVRHLSYTMSYADFAYLGEKALNQGAPFLPKVIAVILLSGAAIPVVGVPLLPFLAVEISMDGHGLWRFQIVDEGMSRCPIPLRVPPESGKRITERGRRQVGVQCVGELLNRHQMFLSLPSACDTCAERVLNIFPCD